MSSPAGTLDARLCPLCGQSNQCAMETGRATGVKQPPCWCTRATFAPELLGQVPGTARGRACVCRSCAERAPDAKA